MANRTPKKRPFALNDADITYPFKNEHVTAFQLWLAGAIVPAIVIVIVSLVLVPWPGIRRRAIRRRLLLRKLWELHGRACA